jgi:expansin (peptidoglycan-binding protein)
MVRHLLPFLLLGCSPPGPPVVIGEKVDGLITFYDRVGLGACGYDVGESDFAAINTEQWAGSAACGTCIEITGPKGKAVVRTIDLCPECKRGHLDLSRAAFNKLAEASLGRVNVTWQAVTCPVSGNVRLQMKDGSNPYWTAVQVRNSRRPVTTLEVNKGGTWKTVPRTDYNYFLDESGFGIKAVQVRITADNGSHVTGTVPSVQAGAELEMSAQFL